MMRGNGHNFFFCLFLFLSCCTCQRWLKPWTYNCTKGVFDWSGSYLPCLETKYQQSPINIVTSGDNVNYRDATDTKEIQAHFYPGPFVATMDLLLEVSPGVNQNNLQQIVLVTDQLVVECNGCKPVSNTLKTAYDLNRIVFHHPSEHTINGQRFPIEIQMYLTNSYSQTQVGRNLAVAIFGIIAPTDFVTPMISDLATLMKEKLTSKGIVIQQFNPSSLIPTNSGFYSYLGSDTAPPCTKFTEWIILEHPVNFTSDMIDAINNYNTQYHPKSHGISRPTMEQLDLDIVRYGLFNDVILKVSAVPESTAQYRLDFEHKLSQPSIYNLSSSYYYSDDYHLVTESSCTVVSTKKLKKGIPVATPPEILRLQPDTSFDDQLPIVSANRPSLSPPRTPTTTTSIPDFMKKARQKYANWTSDESKTFVEDQWKLNCKTWLASGKNLTKQNAIYCGYLSSSLPKGSVVYGNFPMPIPPVFEKKAGPQNFPFLPPQLLDPQIPSQVNPYNPYADKFTRQIPTDPNSGSGYFIKNGDGKTTPYLKPLLSAPPIQ